VPQLLSACESIVEQLASASRPFAAACPTLHAICGLPVRAFRKATQTPKAVSSFRAASWVLSLRRAVPDVDPFSSFELWTREFSASGSLRAEVIGCDSHTESPRSDLRGGRLSDYETLDCGRPFAARCACAMSKLSSARKFLACFNRTRSESRSSSILMSSAHSVTLSNCSSSRTVG
jgi:hypothetical protein